MYTINYIVFFFYCKTILKLIILATTTTVYLKVLGFKNSLVELVDAQVS